MFNMVDETAAQLKRAFKLNDLESVSYTQATDQLLMKTVMDTGFLEGGFCCARNLRPRPLLKDTPFSRVLERNLCSFRCCTIVFKAYSILKLEVKCPVSKVQCMSVESLCCMAMTFTRRKCVA